MANPDPPTPYGTANGLDRPGDGAPHPGTPTQPAAAVRNPGMPSAAVGHAHEETAGEKIGRFFRRAMDRLGGNEPEWRREETGRPARTGLRDWTPVLPSLRIPPRGRESVRRTDEFRRPDGHEDEGVNREGFSRGDWHRGHPAQSGAFARRPSEFSSSVRPDVERKQDPYERGQSFDEDRQRRVGREHDSWNEWGESAQGATERAWQREPLAARDVMTRNPQTVARGGTLRDAAVIMREENCGVVPIVDGAGRLQGILTDRDIVIRGATDDPRTSRVEDVMTDEVSAVTEDEPLTSVLDLMGRRQIRRVPVVDRSDRLLGIISMADIATRADYDEDLQDAFLRISSRRSFWSLFS